jgi:hypothetical protein
MLSRRHVDWLSPELPIRRSQAGMFLCFPEHGHANRRRYLSRTTGAWRLEIRDQFVPLAGDPQAQKFGMADMEPIEKQDPAGAFQYLSQTRNVAMFRRRLPERRCTQIVGVSNRITPRRRKGL